MMEKLLLLDKDGTLIETASGQTFVQTPWDQQPLTGVKDAIARYVAEGWQPCIISNQGGVERGYKSLEETIAEMRFCLELLPGIAEAYFCPDFSGADCWRVWGDCAAVHRILYGCGCTTLGDKLQPFRKPGGGMIQLAIDIHNADQVLYVGDRPEDQAAAQAAFVPFLSAETWRSPLDYGTTSSPK